jgi:hypothetical protein
MKQDYPNEEEDQEEGVWQGIRLALIVGLLAACCIPLAEWVARWWMTNH